MSLAQRLNDLAAAHDHRIISDDDYRILRQDLFNRFAAEPHSPPPPPNPAPPPPTPPLRHKPSVVSNVANLLRRATGRSPKKPPKPAPQPPTAHDHDDPAALRTAIASTEAEHARLLDAFTALESSTLKRIQYKTARRLYTPTPTSVSVLIEGRNWRRHTKPVPSIVLPPPLPPTLHPDHRHHTHRSSSAAAHTSDRLSVHSAASSSKLSLSRSVSSLPRTSTSPPQQPQSPLSPRLKSFHTLQRQNSVSSASTQSTGTSTRLALGTRSTGNLYLASLAERASDDTVAESRITEDIEDIDNDDPEARDYDSALRELHDIRRRRQELEARHLSRLEYLKAALRAAELRDRVSRR